MCMKDFTRLTHAVECSIDIFHISVKILYGGKKQTKHARVEINIFLINYIKLMNSILFHN